MSTCDGAELPDPASRTPAAALLRIRRPVLLLPLLLPLMLLLLVAQLPLPKPPPMPLLLALLPLLRLASIGPRRDWKKGLDEAAEGGGEERVADDDGPIIIVVVPLLSRAAI